jgi:deoxyribonuclease V
VIAALDVHYGERTANAACVLFAEWSDEAEADTCVARLTDVAAYLPGQFYLRELPCLLAVLGRVQAALACIVIDGYAWLAEGKPGLGARLHAAARVPVVGVAKSPFRGARAVEVVRGRSKRPLYVTAAGCGAEEAAARVKAMHGPHRLPTLLARADAIARSVL